MDMGGGGYTHTLVVPVLMLGDLDQVTALSGPCDSWGQGSGSRVIQQKRNSRRALGRSTGAHYARSDSCRWEARKPGRLQRGQVEVRGSG